MPADTAPLLPTPSLLDHIRPQALSLPESGIVEVMNYGRRHEGLIPLWAGEGDLPTPAFISEAATRSLAAGETFYTWQRGIPELRAAIAGYMHRLYGVAEDPERYYVTGSGMQAIQIALALTLSAGEEILIPSPAWPNAAAAAEVVGARPVFVPFSFDPARGFWLDLGRLESAVTPRTRVIFINSPANPTGFVASHDTLRGVLDIARRHGLWIVADEIYGRFFYEAGEGGPARAPSFHDVMEEEDRILFVQTFSKNWAMTGWRLGWIEAHPSLGPVLENLIQYATSGVAAFMQRAGVAALERGESFVAHQIERARRGRDIVAGGLASSNRVRFASPPGAFYMFFGVEGEVDMRALALRLVDEAGIGLAPGTAFGPGGERYIRMCFARGEAQMSEATDRLVRWLQK
ncbi:pyridoxal phosphate-dependent aminotransferase [Ancylobacter dichloromethanicus]|uniref:aspartate transaminase n=1 Tax=Ancylobacter dichloromethanicus TaxID=518825 RepID=A0A9W6MZ23_9HYPH|nr:pyridoxal phosphate-dependent aminotransferase [Ancylobacter dichloromethanicus]MBS7555040.1 pyridoxal phosphate-dependent aminotransferase [Ancylobacter dichloromethanicus]GLK72249.1 aminotransferase [Ancylobacter dichloromethanicus]